MKANHTRAATSTQQGSPADGVQPAEDTFPSFDDVFEHSLDLVCVAGTDGFFKRVNPAFQRTLGYTAAQLLSRSFMQFVHPEDRAETESVMSQLSRGEPCVRLDNRYLCADGTFKWLQWTAAPDAKTNYLYAVAREITGSKLAEAQLRERDEQLVEAQSIAALGSWTRDIREGTVTWSEQMYRLLGYEPFSFAPTTGSYLQHVCEEDRARITALVTETHVGAYSHEYKIERTDGEIRTVQARGRTIVDATGTPLRHMGTLQDITERVRAEQEGRLLARVTHAMHGGQNLRQATLAALAELCDVAAWDYGELWLPQTDGSALGSFASYAHKRSAGLRLFQERSEALICRPHVTLPGRVWSNGAPEWQADLSTATEDVFCRADLARSAGLRASVGLPLFIDKKTGGVLVLLRERATPQDPWQLQLLRTVAEQLGVLLQRKQAEDALLQSEARFQAAALATNDVIYDWDFASNTLELSDALRRVYGYDLQRVAIEWWSELLHPDDVPAAWSSLTAAIEDRNAHNWTGEYRFRRADDQYAHVMDRGYFFRDALGKVTRMVGTMLDQTERVLVAEALRHAKDAAEDAGRAKSEFLANMSHEIRTPLTAVLGFADLLLDPALSQSDRLNYAMTIRRNGEHLLSILNDILDISKIEAGKVVLEKILCSPAQLLTDVASLMRVRAAEKGLSFEVEYMGPIPAEVRTDPTRLRQIVLNLVSNAIKFTEQGNVRIMASCHGATGESRLEISVKDTGIGISADQQKTLFQPFAQADPSMTRKFGGSGLGLGISAPLAAALGGSIDVESTPGKGSTFTLRIPVEIPPGTELVSNPLEALGQVVDRHSTLPSEENQHSGRVLLAEDGRDNQVLISRLLSKEGFAVSIVANGQLAVEQAMRAHEQGQPFDVVLMDMQMPELDGYGAAAALRSRGYQGAIVALTAHALAGERERCIAAGCNDYLSKPVQRTRLVEAVAAHTRSEREKHAARVITQPPMVEANIAPASDEAPLISEYADDPDIGDIVAQFVAGMPAQLLALSEAIQMQDATRVARLAHQLKGAAGGYGFPSVSTAAAELEHVSGSPPQAAEIVRSFQALERLCQRIAPAAAIMEARPRLLVIDDSPSIHDLVEARLRSENILVERACDAAQGLQAARERAPDLILLDLHLPDLDGIEVCRMLKANVETAAIPIIFLTGASDAHTKAAALDLGAMDYVTKPFDAVELRARVRSALRTKQYQELLAGRAQLDALTGLWNRAHFDIRLREEEAAALRHGRPFSLMMLDVDHFKQINDNYGHPFGDRVLQAIAGALRKTARTNDVVCRYGGEEFVIILRDTPTQSGLSAAERMLSAVRQLSFPTHAQELHVTVSVGLAADERRTSEREAFAVPLLAAADAALYAAKRAGRDRVVSTSL